MLDGKRVGVVIPAYNEEHLIAATIAGIPDFVDRITVVDDQSKDGTVAAVAGDPGPARQADRARAERRRRRRDRDRLQGRDRRIFGFSDVEAASATIAQWLFGIFLVLFLGALIIGLSIGARLTS